jgi:phage shock protein C
MNTTDRRLVRSRRDRKIAGVCGGIAEHFGWDPTVVRLVVILSILLPGPQVLAYLLAWIVMPEDDDLV